MNQIYHLMCSRQAELIQEIEYIQQLLSSMPDKFLICAKNGNSFKWYESDGHHCSYLPKKHRIRAEQLAKRRYFNSRLQHLQAEKRAIDSFMKSYPDEDPSAKMLLPSSGYHDLLSSYFSLESEDLNQWANEPYEHCPHHPERLVHETASGHLVRSKSEAMIAMLLYQKKIPFRYECVLSIRNTMFYPDFTIRHPDTGKYLYWEHLGLMDDPDYNRNACSKIQLYAANNIIPTIQLILTAETLTQPLTYNTVQHTIQQYFNR